MLRETNDDDTNIVYTLRLDSAYYFDTFAERKHIYDFGLIKLIVHETNKPNVKHWNVTSGHGVELAGSTIGSVADAVRDSIPFIEEWAGGIVEQQNDLDSDVSTFVANPDGVPITKPGLYVSDDGSIWAYTWTRLNPPWNNRGIVGTVSEGRTIGLEIEWDQIPLRETLTPWKMHPEDGRAKVMRVSASGVRFLYKPCAWRVRCDKCGGKFVTAAVSRYRTAEASANDHNLSIHNIEI